MDGSGRVLMVEINAFTVMLYHQASCSRKLRIRMTKQRQLQLKNL